MSRYRFGGTPGPWRFEPSGGHAHNRIVGVDIVQTGGWPERRGGASNASFSDQVCENLGDPALPGPRANILLIELAPEMADLLLDIDHGGEVSATNLAHLRSLARRLRGEDVPQ